MTEHGSRAVLVLLNGPPGSGKSTQAHRWAEAEERLHVIDIDTIRSRLALWPSRPEAAGLEARVLATSEITDLLADGRCVVVPQFLRRVAFLEELEAVARTEGAAFIECALRLDRDVAVQAFLQRSAEPTAVEHLDADVMVQADDRPEQLRTMYDDLTALCASRPRTRFVDVSRGDVETTFERLRETVPEV